MVHPTLNEKAHIMKKVIAVLAMLPFGAGAEPMVPAIDKTAAIFSQEMVAPSIQLTEKEKHALALAREWKNNPDKPRRAAEGHLKYLFGVGMPSMICTPMQVCGIRLQAGENINGVDIGDARWKISTSMVGSEESPTWVMMVIPTETGLTTTLMVTTDRRIYTIKLVSAKHESIPLMSFDYPDDMERTFANFRNRQARAKEASTLITGENVEELDFNFRMSGDSPAWKPVRVYTNGVKTYVEFPDDKFAEGMPALIELGGDGGLFRDESNQIVNYRPIGKRFVIDKKLTRFALILGIDKQEKKVVFDYEGKK